MNLWDSNLRLTAYKSNTLYKYPNEVGLPDFMDTCASWNALIILTSPNISVVAYYFATIALKLDHDLLDSFCEGSIKTETVPLYG